MGILSAPLSHPPSPPIHICLDGPRCAEPPDAKRGGGALEATHPRSREEREEQTRRILSSFAPLRASLGVIRGQILPPRVSLSSQGKRGLHRTSAFGGCIFERARL